LKLYRRAELIDERGKKLIEDLYVDPLPNDHILKTVLNNNTTFLIGRKGTGKSTIFQRAQYELDNDKTTSWAYIDIKSLYESSTSEIVGTVPLDQTGTLDPYTIQKIHIFRCFMTELIKEIKIQIENRIKTDVWSKVKDHFTGSSSELFEKLDEFISEINSEEYLNITGGFVKQASTETSDKVKDNEGLSLAAGFSTIPSGSLKYIVSQLKESQEKRSEKFSHIYIRFFRIKELIYQLKQIISSLKLQRIYIFIDDFSELPKNEMEEVVDTILTPFNNWSDEFIKLKVAVYPGRLYLGDIDRTKIDEVYLDIYRAYGRGDLTAMEKQAVNFTKRLLERRLAYYCKSNLETYFSTSKSEEDIWMNLFYSSVGNPRILGYILYFCYETSIIHGVPISVSSIKDAAKRYFAEKIGANFKMNKFLHESFDERSSIYSLKELFEELVKRSKELRTYRESNLMKEITGRPPTSHFHILSEFESILSSLELNFFLTKYYEMRDRDGREVSVYALNYGLCQQESISFGRPREKREQRLYFVERIFDYSYIIRSYLTMNQEIICDFCGTKHKAESLSALEQYDMLCPTCKKGICKVVNLSRKYADLINQVSENALLPQTELGILKTLHDERQEMFAKQIALELDCSYQLVGKRGRNLSDRELVVRTENESGRRVFQISEKATKTYFENNSEQDQFDFGNE
jgi:DNA-binding MarR family transcriptional regulator